MPKVIGISAVDSAFVMGVGNNLPFHCPAELRHFKEQTIGKTVVMGYNTMKTLTKPLPHRDNIVITTRPIKDVVERGFTFLALDKFKQYYLDNPHHENDVFYLIGGPKLFTQAFNGGIVVDEWMLSVFEKQTDFKNGEKHLFPAEYLEGYTREYSHSVQCEKSGLEFNVINYTKV